MPEIERALDHPVDFKSTLPGAPGADGPHGGLRGDAELGPPHDRTFEVVAIVEGEELGRGSGRSKKHAEQDAAQIALDGMVPSDEDEEEEVVLEEPASGGGPLTCT
jgi:ribonuclease-3